MKKLNCNCRLVQHAFHQIHLVDKCLLLFMIVLLLQSAYSFFILPCASDEAHTIDVIIRTSISGIFGYLLSANFIRHEAPGSGRDVKTETTSLSAGDDFVIKNSIGFTAPQTETTLTSGVAHVNSPQDLGTQKNMTELLQILVATAIGLFCLVMLILVRDLSVLQIIDPSTSSFTATVSQFRDLVSSCVGFLIGCPTNIKKDI